MTGGDAGDDFALGHWVELALLDRPGHGGLLDLLRAHGSPRAALMRGGAALGRTMSREQLRRRVLRCLHWLEGRDNHALTLGAEDYPRTLLDTPSPPLLVCASGDTGLLEGPKLMLVGEEDATENGMENTEIICRALAGKGYTIVSGPGRGIEAGARRGAAGRGARLATVFDSVFGPDGDLLDWGDGQWGVALYGRPYPDGTRGEGAQARQLGVDVCDGCLVIEATLKGDSLRLAQYALETGKEVFAMPGSVNSVRHRGCHRLIRDGAHLVESQHDVISVIGGG